MSTREIHTCASCGNQHLTTKCYQCAFEQVLVLDQTTGVQQTDQFAVHKTLLNVLTQLPDDATVADLRDALLADIIDAKLTAPKLEMKPVPYPTSPGVGVLAAWHNSGGVAV